jgi:putative ABC transport system substrate-binding protein
MKRTTVPSILVAVVLLALGVTAEAQQAKKVPRIGFLSGSGNPFAVEAFRQGLRDLGYTEGKNILIEYRYAERMLDQAPDLVAELVQLKVDVLVSTAQPMIRAAKQATKTIPIVMVATFDPVATGVVDSLARPGGNITGLSTLARELSGKRLELLKEVVPRISRVALLFDSNTPGLVFSFKEYETAARALKIPLQSLGCAVRTPI